MIYSLGLRGKVAEAWREISASWQGGTMFLGTNKDGAQVQIGKQESQPGIGPMEAVLVALAACTGDDVISILKKKRQTITSFKIDVRGKRVEESPRVYSEIIIEYHLEGEGLIPKDVEQAIKLSEEKYCSVGAMLNRTAKIQTTYHINSSSTD